MSKPTVLVDCDGVLADFVGGVCREVNKTIPERVHQFKPKDFTEWDIGRLLPSYWKGIVSRPGFCYGLEPYPDAKEGMKTLLDSGAKAIVVTSPWTSDSWISERIEWLRCHFSIDRTNIIFADSGHKALIKGDFLIEDNLPTLQDWSRENKGYGYLIDRPWNQDATLLDRVDSFSAAVEAVLRGQGAAE